MAQPYVGEIRIFAGNFAPAGWMFCEGQLLPISSYDVLFQLIGTTYGGDGASTFALPDLRGRMPMHFGAGFTQGALGGQETVQLTTAQIPGHNHLPQAVSNGVLKNPTNNLWTNWPGAQYHNNQSGLSPLNPAAMYSAGGSQPHENRPPYLAINFIISLFGIYPSQA